MKTTKGGKVMNPTDAYRKELRKKELKRVSFHVVVIELFIAWTKKVHAHLHASTCPEYAFLHHQDLCKQSSVSCWSQLKVNFLQWHSPVYGGVDGLQNKKERKKVREVGILKKDPDAIKEQIRKLEMMSVWPFPLTFIAFDPLCFWSNRKKKKEIETEVSWSARNVQAVMKQQFYQTKMTWTLEGLFVFSDVH